ncbi:MAG: hypothetical protein ACE37J_13980 [Pikeienuella sp.]|uniref:hypothetical protein n=1 Tax=Pikeienuella sp. TaxID=2831957 RepID=UPI003919DE5D
MPDWMDLAFNAKRQVERLSHEVDDRCELVGRDGDAVIIRTWGGAEGRIEIGPIAALVAALRALPEAKP